MAFVPPWIVFQRMTEIEARLDSCRKDVVEAFMHLAIIRARDMAESGIELAKQNEDFLTPRARNLWAHLHHWKGLTQENVFDQSKDIDKALLLVELPDPEFRSNIYFWFHSTLAPTFVAELDKCRHKTEKPALPLACYLGKLKHLQTMRDRGGAVTQGYLDMVTHCCILAKLLWKQNPIFPKESAIVELFEEHAGLCVKQKLWDPARIDIEEIVGYSATPSSRFYQLAAEVELNIRGQQLSPELTLKSHGSALDHVTEGLKVYPGDQDLIKMKTTLDAGIRKLQCPPSPSPRQVPNPTVSRAMPPRLKRPEEESIRARKSLNTEQPSPSSSTKVERETPSVFLAPVSSVADAGETPAPLGKLHTKKRKSAAQTKKRRVKQKMKYIQRKRDKEVNALEEQRVKKDTSIAAGEPKTPKLPKETELRVQNKPACGGGKLKKKAKRNESKASAALYEDLTAQYCITYGCDVCTSVSNQTVEVKVVAHGCYATKLLLQERSDPLMKRILVRPCPQGYTPSQDPEDLCEHFLNGEECREKARCPKPHSKVEKLLWDKYFRKKIGFSRFMKDLVDSPLRVKNELGRICLRYNGRYTFVCRLCYRKDQTASKKKSHKPECSNGHAWNESRLLVFEKTNGNHEIVVLDQTNASDEAEEIQKCLKELMKCRFTEEEVVNESSALNQRQNALVRNAGKQKKRKKSKRSDDHRKKTDDNDGEREWEEENCYDSELDYDSDLEDTMTVWDSDEEECEEQQREDDQAFEREPYYTTASESQLWDLLRKDPVKYKLCNIQLDGPFAARCKVLEKDPQDNIREIEIRGRMNCGQTLDGDEVVVEVKSTEVLDSKEDKVLAEQKSMAMAMYKNILKDKKREKKPESDYKDVREGVQVFGTTMEVKTETRGVVVGITRKTLNRKAYTFLCRADRYYSHLMKPLDGIAPKLHVISKVSDKLSVTVYAMQDGALQPKKIIKLDPLKRERTLFVVRYLKWAPASMYPLGYVSHVIRIGDTIARSQQIINILHQVPTKPNPACDEAASLMDVDIREDKTWKDLRKLFVFSIDPPNCRDVDDALSVKQIGEDEFLVGVHIADVTHYVCKDDAIDKNARRRATSYYAATGKVYGMLPVRLSEDIVSLREGEERRVLSVIFHITKKKGIVGKPDIFRSVVLNRKQLTYEEAETFIDKIGTNESTEWKENDLECAISKLHLIAVGLRKNRIGDGRFYYQSDKPFEMQYPYESHRLVEEFMILTNRYIGSFLENKFPGCIPLRLQDAPNEEDLDKWKDANAMTVLRSLYFKQYASLRPEDETAASGGNVSILMPTLDAIVSAADAGDVKKMKTLIGLEDFHPLHLLAMVSWYGIQEKATFSCSMESQIDAVRASEKASLENQGNSDLSPGNSNIGADMQNRRSSEARIGHFSLQIKHYVQFTSPIRRFMDIIIHRFVKAALDGEPSPYSYDEVQTICKSTNKITIRSRRYDKACTQLKSTDRLQQPFRIPFIVESFDGNAISLTSPYLSHLRRGQRSLAYSSLLVSQKPELQDNKLILSWERRFYDQCVSLSIARSTAQTHDVLELDSERHSAQADPATWKGIQHLVKSNAPMQLLQQLVQTLVYNDKLRKQGLSKRLEITSEMKPDQPLVKYHVRFRQTLKRGTVLQVQVGAECLNGYLQPVCQLLQLTNEKDICLQHGRDPVKCFAKLATETVATRYESAEHYKRVWLPIITMEAATQAAAAGDAILCNNVPIKFLRRNEKYYGTLKLPLDFCRKRQIKIFTAEDDDDDSNDYMCIRFRPQHPPSGANTSSIDSVQDRIWVAHVVSTKSRIKKEGIGGVASRIKNSPTKAPGRQMVFLDFIVQHHNGLIPPELLLDENYKMCTVEFLAKSLPDRRMEAAVTAIDEASELCVSIVLKTSIPRDTDIEMPESENYDIETDAQGVPRNNRIQIKAIKRALRDPFTVIQGPPGTGKTVTGVKLIYWFAKANKQLRDGEIRPQILYCGPSNSAVDVAASLLIKYLGTNRRLKIVRVYSDMLEKQVYPIPRDAAQICLQKGKRYDLMENENQRDIALHHLIRKPHNEHSKRLKEFDAMFAKNSRTPERVSDKDVEEYLKLVTTACVDELPKYDVVFCTCAASSSKKMRLGTQIRQIIIDECGMCMEPESQIPLVCYKDAKQVVLIGDHKQLQPIVTCGLAKDLGMQKSLFERYEDRAIMLDEQYRMAFYDSKLRTATLLIGRQWTLAPIWPSRSHPCTVFIHVEGREKTLSVSTDEGNQQSKSNEAERDEVTRVFTQLVNRSWCHIPEEKIAILSQYKAQCSEIEKNLKEVGFQSPRVNTVVASQGGEWQYVILSLVRSIPRYEIENRPSEGWCKRNMGFIIDRHQINVALTRAKIGLIIVGNKHLLRCDSMWRELLEHYDRRGCIVEANTFVPQLQMQRNTRDVP